MDCFLTGTVQVVAILPSVRIAGNLLRSSKCSLLTCARKDGWRRTTWIASCHAPLATKGGIAKTGRDGRSAKRLCESLHRSGMTWQSMNDDVDCFVATRKDT